jgi:hypothetical protein
VVDWGEQATFFTNEAEKGLMMCDKSIYSTNNAYRAPDINRNKPFNRMYIILQSNITFII